jgi:hypothetical protein
MIDMLKTIGIEKGRSGAFKPDAKTRSVLDAAAREARGEIDARYEAVFAAPYFEGSHWAVPASHEVVEGMATSFSSPDGYPIDGRAAAYSMAYFSRKHLGAGQFYLMAIKDKSGAVLDGKKAYRLTVAANAPVKLYWSATAYDRQTHALIRETTRSSRASNSADIQKNPDGSVDVFFGPEAPAGKESNWVPTNGRGFEVLFRFYGPEKPLFDKAWKLADLELVN